MRLLLFLFLSILPLCGYAQDTLKTKYFEVIYYKIKAVDVFENDMPLSFYGYYFTFINLRKIDSVIIKYIYTCEEEKIRRLNVSMKIDFIQFGPLRHFITNNLSVEESPNYGASEVSIAKFPSKYKNYKGNCIIVYEVRGRQNIYE